MVPKYFSAGLLLAIVGICSGFDSGYLQCPNDTDAIIQVGDVQRQEPPTILGFETIDIRIPDSSLLERPITCVIATDLSGDGTGGNVELVGGGVTSKYVELKITSNWLRGINYRVQVYTSNVTKFFADE